MTILKLFILSISFAVTTPMLAQITIGCTKDPRSGTLLDLSEENITTKGLNLPRVKLVSLTVPNGKSFAQTIDGNTAEVWDKNDHIGLLVYNTVEDICLTEPIIRGVHVWNGEEWQLLADNGRNPNVYEVEDPRDGEVYLARNFGDIAGDWMLENMRYDPNKDPKAIENGFTGYIHGAATSYTIRYYCYPEKNVTVNTYNANNSPSENWENVKNNGLLYNWLAATNGQNPYVFDQGQTPLGTDPVSPSIQGICPPDWHLPSDKEWNDLEYEMAHNAPEYSTYTEAPLWDPRWVSGINLPSANNYRGAHAIALKSPCPVSNSPFPNTSGQSYSPWQGGFALLLTGMARQQGIEQYGQYGLYWTASHGSQDVAWARIATYNANGLNRHRRGRNFLHSVRCKKND